jgi:regulator of protease activity HflC (stomatin/prohibitin superfamily)
MKTKTWLILTLSVMAFVLTSCVGCNRVKPNCEGVLMQHYGRNGKDDFKLVQGSQGILLPGSELYNVPMWEQRADPPAVTIITRDGGAFTVDPVFTFQPMRGKGVDIVFNYKHVGLADPNKMMDNIGVQILDPLVINAYREEARNYSTDSLLTHMNIFEQHVENRLKQEFERKFFSVTSLSSGLKPPASMIAAIERRNNAIQQAEQVKNELAVAKMELEKAKIEAEANKVRAQGLTQPVLTEKWIDAIKTTQNKVIITDGKTPVIIGGNH